LQQNNSILQLAELSQGKVQLYTFTLWSEILVFSTKHPNQFSLLSNYVLVQSTGLNWR